VEILWEEEDEAAGIEFCVSERFWRFVRERKRREEAKRMASSA
jgi:hypothetical protein